MCYNPDMKKIFIAAVLIASFFAQAFCQDVASADTADKADTEKKLFYLSPLRDSLLMGGGAALAGTIFVLDNFVKINHDEFSGDLADKSSIPALDRLFMNKYSKGLDLTCDIMRTSILLAPVPLFLFTTSKSEWFTLAMMYGETLLWTWGTTDFIKNCVGRARPYMYYDGAPEVDIKDGDWKKSFPSGHTSITFASAAFTSFVFWQYYPESAWRWGVTGISFGLAGTVAALRMAGGCHFFTDVLTGALIGSAYGILIPWLHTRAPMARKTSGGKTEKLRGFEMDVAPGALVFTVRK